MFDIEKISNRSVWNISNLSEGEGVHSYFIISTIFKRLNDLYNSVRKKKLFQIMNLILGNRWSIQPSSCIYTPSRTIWNANSPVMRVELRYLRIRR